MEGQSADCAYPIGLMAVASLHGPARRSLP